MKLFSRYILSFNALRIALGSVNLCKSKLKIQDFST